VSVVTTALFINCENTHPDFINVPDLRQTIAWLSVVEIFSLIFISISDLPVIVQKLIHLFQRNLFLISNEFYIQTSMHLSGSVNPMTD